PAFDLAAHPFDGPRQPRRAAATQPLHAARGDNGIARRRLRSDAADDACIVTTLDERNPPARGRDDGASRNVARRIWRAFRCERREQTGHARTRVGGALTIRFSTAE